MDIKRAKQEIIDTVQAYLRKDARGQYVIPSYRQRPVMLMGAPGIGKTAIMEQVARDCNIGLVSYTMTHHTRQSALGLPYIDKKTYQGKEYSQTSYTMSEIIASVYEKIEATGCPNGILFIDEINCVSETLAPVMLQFLQCKTFGNAKVPEGWVIVAAGNPPEYNRSVREFDVVTLDRVKMIHIEPDYNAWKQYAYENNIHGAIMAYLEAKQENFYSIKNTVDGKQFVTARGWEDLSNIMLVYEEMKISIDAQLIEQYVQDPAIAVDFANFLELYYKYEKAYNIDDIINGNYADGLVKKIKEGAFDEKISVVGMIISRLNKICMEEYLFDQITTKVYEVLKYYNSKIMQDVDLHALDCLKEIASDRRLRYNKSKENGMLGGIKELTEFDVLSYIDSYVAVLSQAMLENAQGEAVTAAEAFEIVRNEFVKLSQQREDKIEQASTSLNNAFDFCDKAFGQTPQMVLFVTELAAGFYTLKFIQDNGCERYYSYNQDFSGDDRRKKLMEQITIN